MTGLFRWLAAAWRSPWTAPLPGRGRWLFAALVAAVLLFVALTATPVHR